jgi:hydroxymethylglutaryl-CoA lyase
VPEFFVAAREALPGMELTAHFHNTRGQGLANVLAALEVGIDSFESSFGELGGCPVPAGATGNIATEDLVSMLHEMGISTGIDLAALLEASREVQAVLGRPLGSHLLSAGPVDWHEHQELINE